MEPFSSAKVFFVLVFWFQFSSSSSSSSSSLSASSCHPLIKDSISKHWNHTAISDFRIVNRRILSACLNSNPNIQIIIDSNKKLSDDGFVKVRVSGIANPSENEWIALMSPSTRNDGFCPLKRLLYAQTGDLASLPLLCDYPVKAQWLKSDPDYLSCTNSGCNRYENGKCLEVTCNATLTFHVINFRTDISFVLLAGGFGATCTWARTDPLGFANPNKPLYGHLSSVDSTGTSMKLTWVSGDRNPQHVEYDNGKILISEVTTFSQKDMCGGDGTSPAKDFGWHDPGFIHYATMTGLKPSATFSYRYGSESVGWSETIQFKTPPAAGSDEVNFIIFGDMGKAPLDNASIEHYIQPGSVSVVKAMIDEVNTGKFDSIFHIGDISYATGFLVEWDYFLHLITPLASRLSYMTAIGNHERDYGSSGSYYGTPDSGGECGVPYETYFRMPIVEKDKPWYSIEQGGVHFIVISTEHDFRENTEQYQWIKRDLALVDRSRTTWIIFTGHRHMYSSFVGFSNGDNTFVVAMEPLLVQYKVDLVLLGHVHNYERTCAVYGGKCLDMPKKDENGIDVYDLSDYKAPPQVVIGMAGFTLDKFDEEKKSWSLVRIAEYGYTRVHATKDELNLEYVNAETRLERDRFRIIKKKQ
ncbi:probable inactive purple acid phosphatase 27 [Tripterygium wilfordii]|uniref:probable inactive purple acid phosphatase 27 n=1 Tax=Tripterygium wilfordii TaxID=458696 RepID=UPI0018F7EE70|nr:probable inactive purple acid phosphatase 27 [Tripterygium wilfordii]